MPGICPRCERYVYCPEEKYAFGRVWHAFCLSCCRCRKLLNSCTIVFRGRELYCRSCYDYCFCPGARCRASMSRTPCGQSCCSPSPSCTPRPCEPPPCRPKSCRVKRPCYSSCSPCSSCTRCSPCPPCPPIRTCPPKSCQPCPPKYCRPSTPCRPKSCRPCSTDGCCEKPYCRVVRFASHENCCACNQCESCCSCERCSSSCSSKSVCSRSSSCAVIEQCSARSVCPRDTQCYYNRQHTSRCNVRRPRCTSSSRCNNVCSPSYTCCSVGCGLGGGCICNRCHRKVYHAEMLLAAQAVYHNSCFSCFECRKPLEKTNYYECCGEIYCKLCYCNTFGVLGYGYGAGAAPTLQSIF